MDKKCGSNHGDYFMKNLDEAIALATEGNEIITTINLMNDICGNIDEVEQYLKRLFVVESDLKEILKILMKLSKIENLSPCEIFKPIVESKVRIRFVISQLDYLRDLDICSDDNNNLEFFIQSFVLFSDIQNTVLLSLTGVRAVIIA